MNVLRAIWYWIVWLVTFRFLWNAATIDVEPPRIDPPRPVKPVCPKVPDCFQSNAEHLHYEMQYIDLLVRAQVCRWELMIGQHKPAEAWGILMVNPAEVDAYLRSPFTPAGEFPAAVVKASKRFTDAALAMREKIRRARDASPPSAGLRMPRLLSRLGLQEEELDVILLSTLPLLDERYQRLFAMLQDDGSLTHPRVSFLLQVLNPVFGSAARARTALDHDGMLWQHRILEQVDEGRERSLSIQQVRVDPRIVEFIVDDSNRYDRWRDGVEQDDRLDDILSGPFVPIDLETLVIDDELEVQLCGLADALREDASQIGAVFLYGPYGSGREQVARALAGATGRGVLIADARVAVGDVEDWKRKIELCYREARLQNAALLWKNADRLDEDEVSPRWRELLLARAETDSVLTLFSGTRPWDPPNRFHHRRFVRLPLGMPNAHLRRRLWIRILPTADEFRDLEAEGRAILANNLADAFQLTEGQMRDAVAAARALASRDHADHPLLDVTHLESGCRRQAGRQLNTLATHVAPRSSLSFEDIVLPDAPKSQLEELSMRVKTRSRVFEAYGFDQKYRLGRGLLTLFIGSSGTGKTMAAEILAAQNGRDLYKVDMSQIVSKYVGETEQNLEKVFSQATDSNALLLCDEADSLFGKRGDVKDARDRWANQEVNFLLQRVEEYAGVVIMATNLRKNMDKAFMRRIQVIVDFPFPEANLRLAIWNKALGDAVRSDDPTYQVRDRPSIHELDAKQLRGISERFVLSGGNIRNIVIDAAFRAFNRKQAEASETYISQKIHSRPPLITHPELLLSIAREYQKLGRPINRTDFGKEHFEFVMETLFPTSDPIETSGENRLVG